MMNCNWGADYADPETYTDPFRRGNNYSFIDKAADTEAIEKYYALVDAAKAITGDTQARYLAFAEAEAYLIEHGYVLPFGYGTGSYVGSLLDPFTAPTAAHGISHSARLPIDPALAQAADAGKIEEINLPALDPLALSL